MCVRKLVLAGVSRSVFRVQCQEACIGRAQGHPGVLGVCWCAAAHNVMPSCVPLLCMCSSVPGHLCCATNKPRVSRYFMPCSEDVSHALLASKCVHTR